MYKSIFIYSILIFFIIFIEESQSNEYQLTQLLDSALQNNYLLQANEKNTQIKLAEIEILKTNYQPRISTSLGFSYWKFLLPNKQKLLGETLTDMYTDITIYQTIYDWGENKERKAMVKDEIELNDEILRQIKNTVIWGVSSVYFEALKSKAEITAHQNTLQQLESHLQYANNLYEIGKVSRVDILKINVQISVEEKNLQKAKNDFQSKLIEIKRLCYLAEDENIAIQDISKELYNDTENRSFSADSLYNEILNEHPELSVKDKQIIIESKQKELFKLQNLPEIYSYGIASWEDGYIPFGNNFNYNIGVGIRYSIPYWGGSSYKTEMIQSDYRIEQLKDDKNQILHDIKKEIDLTLNSIIDIKGEISNNKKIIELAAETLDNASVQYQAGQGSIIDVLDAQTILTEANIDYGKSTISYLQTLAMLHYLTGNDNYPFN